jgi:MoxR-like ATPase
MINTSACHPGEALETLEALWELPFSVMLWGPPGVGKSALVRELARRKGVPLKDVRLSHKVASDIGGLPALDHTHKKTTFYLPDFLPDESRDGPEGILFLDELPGADDQTRIASYGLILERSVSNYQLPEGWHIIAAGNRPEDDPVNREFGSAMNDRVVHLLVEPDHKAWLSWAASHDLSREVMAFIHIMPHRLSADPASITQGHAIVPSPRSWERVSEVLKRVKRKRSRELIVSGLVGDAVAHEFFIIAEEVAAMTSIETILATNRRELHRVIPTTISGLYALAYALTSSFNRQSASQILYVVEALDELEGTAHNALPMADVQTLALSLVLERALALGLDVSEHPAFLKLNQLREDELKGLNQQAA